MDRRDFIKKSFLGTLCFSGSRRLGPRERIWEGRREAKPLLRRKLGRTGEELSIIGLGGLVVAGETQDAADQIVREAFEKGVNYFDVAPSYQDAEDRLGPALKPFRKKVFLACKTLKRDAQGAQEELHQSLTKLSTDHLDLYQLHALTKMDDVQSAFGPHGAMETFLKARREGKVRHIGFSAHSAEVALAAMEQFDFDTILFPINFICFSQANFGPQVVERAREKKMGILALKSLALQPWADPAERKNWPKTWYQPIENRKIAKLALRFTLSQPVTAAVPPGDVRLFRLALEIASRFFPLSDEEQAEAGKLASGFKPLFELQPR